MEGTSWAAGPTDTVSGRRQGRNRPNLGLPRSRKRVHHFNLSVLFEGAASRRRTRQSPPPPSHPVAVARSLPRPRPGQWRRLGRGVVLTSARRAEADRRLSPGFVLATSRQAKFGRSGRHGPRRVVGQYIGLPSILLPQRDMKTFKAPVSSGLANTW